MRPVSSLVRHRLLRPFPFRPTRRSLDRPRVSRVAVRAMAFRYAAAFASPNGPGDARPTALDIVRDDDLEGRLTDKVMLVTGCSSGLGIETARALSATGARLFCTARDLKKGEEALAGILEPGRVELLELKLDSLESVRACAKEFLSKSKTLNVMVCNAGIMMPPYAKTVDGFESQFGTNHLGHFLLFNLIKGALLAGSTPSFHSRVVMVSSLGHRGGGIHFDDINLEKDYTPNKGYSQSKTANIYMANEIERRFASKGLHGLSLHPGGIQTGLQIHIDPKLKEQWSSNRDMMNGTVSPAQGAATQVLAAVGKEFEGKGARYLEQCSESGPAKDGYTVLDRGYETWAFDKEKEQKLWTESLKMVGLDMEDDA
ncbi:putative short-chain dehydrogenase protein [Neofusicoccum parvum]|nr:putative short-chain dehydrogenase protein [Neofusicoccum parvum]